MNGSAKGFVTFSSTIPDDSVERGGDIVTPGGRTIAEVVRASLVANGYQVGEVEQRSHYGWEFRLWEANREFDFTIQWVDPWLIILEPAPSLWKRLFGGGRDDAYSRAIDALRRTLGSDERFAGLRWYSRAEFERGERPQ